MHISIKNLRFRYAENESDHLLFRRASSGELLLLETRFSAQLRDFIELHLNQQHSIPVFLAAIITDLFSRRTFDTVEYNTEEEDEERAEEEEEMEEEEEDEDDDEEGEEEEEEAEPGPAATGGDDDDPICID